MKQGSSTGCFGHSLESSSLMPSASLDPRPSPSTTPIQAISPSLSPNPSWHPASSSLVSSDCPQLQLGPNLTQDSPDLMQTTAPKRPESHEPHHHQQADAQTKRSPTLFLCKCEDQVIGPAPCLSAVNFEPAPA